MNICIIDPIERVENTLQRLSETGSTFIRLPLMDDIVINAESDLRSLNDSLPGMVSELINLGITAEQATSGANQVSSTAIKLVAKSDAKQWNAGSTKPLDIQLKVGFFSEVQTEKPLNTISGLANFGIQQAVKKASKDTDITHHWIHTLNALSSFAVLTPLNNGKWSVPGIGLRNLKDVNTTINNQWNTNSISVFNEKNILGGTNPLSRKPVTSENILSKLVRFTIPGIVDIPIAIIPRVSITYSKQITDLGYPLWATADIQINGVVPANSADFIRGTAVGKSIMATSLI